MRISAMEEYGLRALLALARRSEAMTIPDVAQTEGLSEPYASKIMRKLRQAGLVSADRGRTGGYQLTRTPSEITLLHALEALGGPIMSEDHCEKYPGIMDDCVHRSDCAIRGAFGGFVGYMEKILSMTTLADLISNESEARRKVRESAEALIAQQRKKMESGAAL